MKEIYEELGKRIRVERENRGLSQEKFAVECGLNKSHVGAIERGEVNLTIDSLVKIAKTPGTPVSGLLRGVGEKR